MTVGQWLSQIDRETSIELDALDDHVRAKATQTIYDQARTTDSDDDDIRSRQDSPQTVGNVKPYGSCMLIHPQSPQVDTAPNNRTYALASHNKCHDDISINKLASGIHMDLAPNSAWGLYALVALKCATPAV